MAFCLPKEFSEKFLTALKEGKIVPEKLIQMTSEERRTFLADVVGKDDAREVNALLESKLILKDQKRGMVSWAKKIAGISEPARADIIARIEKMDKVLNAKDEAVFLEDLAAKRLGTDVTFDEAKQIADLSKQLTEAKPRIGEGEAARLDYGAKKVALQNYVNELKLSNAKTTLKEGVQNLKTDPIGTVKEGVSKLAGLAKGIKASLDDSAIFRQGWRTLFTHPDKWAANALNSFSNIAKQIGRKAADDQIMNAVKADIYSRPNAVDGLYGRMKLDIGDNEEAYPTSLPEKIPLFGRLYKASEVAYTAFLYKMRADIADKYIEIAKANDVDLTDDLQVRSIGKLVNSLTGRGDLGSFEKIGKQINTLFFSPKMVKSSFDFLTVHAGDKMSGFARKQAAINLLKVVAGTAVILGTAKVLAPNSVELDPRSSDFGDIKIGDTRFNVTGGMDSLVTLAARLVTLSSKSTVTHKVTPLNSGKFGSQTGLDVARDFLSSKASPLFGTLISHLKGQDFSGNKPTILGDASNLLVPLPITNLTELAQDPNGANIILAGIADALGISTNTYSPKKK